MNYFYTSVLIFTLSSLNAQNIWYVNANATGANSGSDWTNAFTDLQDAIAAADTTDQIWVAEGTYYPTDSTDRTATFLLKEEVGVYGGFAGTESSILDRDIAAHPTILSGDIGVSGVQTDNSLHVVTLYGGKTALTTVDGFTIMRGQTIAKNFPIPDFIGAGMLIIADDYHPVSNALIINCIFEYNHAREGGGMACLSTDPFVCAPEIRSCLFRYNLADYRGGGLMKLGGSSTTPSVFLIESCVFEKNNSSYLGGGLSIQDPSHVVRLYNCRFDRDTAIQAAAARLETNHFSVRYEIDSCYFVGNHGKISHGGLEQALNSLTTVDSVELVVKKCTFLLNKNVLGVGAGVSSVALGRTPYHRVHVEDCYFENNASRNGGCAIYIEGTRNIFTESTVDRCFFLGNQTLAQDIIGGFLYRASGGGTDPIKCKNTISNSVFMYNTGAVATLAVKPSTTETSVVNCSFYQNGPYPFHKYWDADLFDSTYIMKMQILNSVIWEPQTDGVQRLLYNNNPTEFNVNEYKIEHSLIHLDDCTYDGFNPCGEGMIYNENPNFIDYSGQIGLLPYNIHPGLNKGSNVVADSFGLLTDHLGGYRICDSTVDIGAYEVQLNCQNSPTYVPAFVSLPVGIRILQNPVERGSTIKGELFSAVAGAYQFRLLDTYGNKHWQGSGYLEASAPYLLAVPSHRLSSGIYYLQVSDKQGRMKTQKVMVL